MATTDFDNRPIYEVKVFGTTVEYDRNLAKAENAYRDAQATGYGQTTLARLDPASGGKVIFRSK